jgi:hypothetical protein
MGRIPHIERGGKKGRAFAWATKQAALAACFVAQVIRGK